MATPKKGTGSARAKRGRGKRGVSGKGQINAGKRQADTGSRRVNTGNREPDVRRLEELVEEAVVDAYGENEQTTGFLVMMAEHLKLPFATQILGVEVTVAKVDMNERGDVVVICQRGRIRQSISVLDLPPPDPQPDGWEWIEAYRHWARGWR